MRSLITGGAGFIGSHLAKRLLEEGETVRVLDNLRSGSEKNLQGLDLEFIKGDVIDPSTVRESLRDVDFIYHLAAMVSVPESMQNPLECVRINVSGTLHLLGEAARSGAKKLVLASSAAIYGEDPTVPKHEEMLPQPRSPYAVSKLDGEYYCDFACREMNLPTVALRFFNVFGPGQDPNSAYAAAMPAFITRALQGGAIQIHGDGEQTRDFIYVGDIVSALRFVVRNSVTGVYNCGYGQSVSIQKMAEEIVRRLESTSPIRHTDARAGDVKHSLAATEKLRGTGWQPEFGLERGLDLTLNWFRSQKSL